MPIATQALLFDAAPDLYVAPPRGQLLKWVGNKQRMAAHIAAHFPPRFNAYHEPFLGSGAILAAVAPEEGYASDSFKPLMEIWLALRHKPEKLKKWYSDRWCQMAECEKIEVYESIKASYNRSPNGADLLFLCRSCYGGIVRFRKADGYMSTPCGVHYPIPPESFARRVDEWHRRVRNTSFEFLEYEEAMRRARRGDLIYCDPPYSHSQAILYGAQDFSLAHLLEVISNCKKRGVFVALSIDGMKKSGGRICDLPIPRGLFEREVFIDCGRSMLKRFQMAGESLEGENVSDRLLLTY
ncbi:MAG TPA: DNA adenine methylase [Thermoanaerobaculia bacterium]|nr:DNA adenine methylase [Thermoanaerobaculia bacterium]